MLAMVTLKKNVDEVVLGFESDDKEMIYLVHVAIHECEMTETVRVTVRPDWDNDEKAILTHEAKRKPEGGYPGFEFDIEGNEDLDTIKLSVYIDESNGRRRIWID